MNTGIHVKNIPIIKLNQMLYPNLKISELSLEYQEKQMKRTNELIRQGNIFILYLI